MYKKIITSTQLSEILNLILYNSSCEFEQALEIGFDGIETLSEALSKDDSAFEITSNKPFSNSQPNIIASTEVADVLNTILYNDYKPFERALELGFDGIECLANTLQDSDGEFTITITN